MLNLKKAGILSLFLISGCSPHPGAGVWLSATENEANVRKIKVFFEPKVLFYSAASEEPVMQCGWWAIDKINIEMECVYLADTDTKEKYQLNVVGNDKAELIKQNKLITELIRQKD